jgi:D-galactarolactone cycloisomerase
VTSLCLVVEVYPHENHPYRAYPRFHQFEHGAPRPSEGLGAGGRFDILFVRVETDAGITGWGEAFGYAAGPMTMAALTRIVAPLAVGRDATDIPGLMGELWFRTKRQARKS